MSKQTGAGIQLSSSTDSFTFLHTPTTHHLTVRGGDIDITGGSGYAYSFPTASTTLVSTDQFQTLWDKTLTGSIKIASPGGDIVMNSDATTTLQIGGSGADSVQAIIWGNFIQKQVNGWGDAYKVERGGVIRWTLDAGDNDFRVTNVSGSVVLSLDTITHANSNDLTLPSGAFAGDMTGAFRATETCSLGGAPLMFNNNDTVWIAYAPHDSFNYNGAYMPHYGFKYGSPSFDPATTNTPFWLSGYGGIRFFTQGASRWFISQSGHFAADGALHISTQGSGTFGSLESSRIYTPTSSLTLEVGAGQRLYLDDGHTNSASIAGVVWSTSDPSGAYPSGTIWCKYTA